MYHLYFHDYLEAWKGNAPTDGRPDQAPRAPGNRTSRIRSTRQFDPLALKASRSYNLQLMERKGFIVKIHEARQ